MRKLIIFALLATTTASAGFCKHREVEPVTVEQLVAILSNSTGSKDKKLAEQIAYLKLTERLSTAKLNDLEKEMPGKNSREALVAIGDESAFLDPPAPEIPNLQMTDAGRQAEILNRTVSYLKTVSSLWPDLSATKLTTMYLGKSTIPAHMPLYSNLPEVGSTLFRPFETQETSSATMIFRGGRPQEKQVNVDANRPPDPLWDRVVGGFYFEPSWFIDSISQHRFTWYGWEQGSAGPIAVFRYAFRSDSNPQLTRLGDQIASENERRIAVNPVDGSICQHRLKIPHCAGRKFLHPGLVYVCSRLIDDETGW